MKKFLIIAILLITSLYIAGCSIARLPMPKELRREALDLYLQGEESERQGEYLIAIDKYFQSIKLSPRPVVYYHLAHCYQMLQDYNSAISYYEKALEMSPDYQLAAMEIEKAKLLQKEKEAGINQAALSPAPSVVDNKKVEVKSAPQQEAQTSKSYIQRAREILKLRGQGKPIPTDPAPPVVANNAKPVVGTDIPMKNEAPKQEIKPAPLPTPSPTPIQEPKQIAQVEKKEEPKIEEPIIPSTPSPTPTPTPVILPTPTPSPTPAEPSKPKVSLSERSKIIEEKIVGGMKKIIKPATNLIPKREAKVESETNIAAVENTPVSTTPEPTVAAKPEPVLQKKAVKEETEIKLITEDPAEVARKLESKKAEEKLLAQSEVNDSQLEVRMINIPTPSPSGIPDAIVLPPPDVVGDDISMQEIEVKKDLKPLPDVAMIESNKPKEEEIKKSLFPSIYSKDKTAESKDAGNFMHDDKPILQTYEFHRDKARQFVKANMLEEATNEFVDALQYKPEDVDCRIELADTYFKLDKKDKAEEHYKKAIEYNPSNSRAYFKLGNFYFKTQVNDQAIFYFDKAIQLDPKYKFAYNNLGVLYMQMERWNDAIFNFKKVIDIDPTYESAYLNLGIILSDVKKEYQSAIQYFQRYIDLRGKRSDEAEKWIKDLKVKINEEQGITE